MRHVQSSDVEGHVAQLLDDVEAGETVVITRDGKVIARLVPEVDERRARALKAMDAIQELRKSMPKMKVEEILSARHEGHKY
jgi:prevent-host-death family protein